MELKREQYEIPRRIRVDLMNAAEIAIYKALEEVQKLPANIGLTDAEMFLIKARDKVADYKERLTVMEQVTRDGKPQTFGFDADGRGRLRDSQTAGGPKCPPPEVFKAEAERALSGRLIEMRTKSLRIAERMYEAERAKGIKDRRAYLTEIQQMAIALLQGANDGLADLLAIEQMEHAEIVEFWRQGYQKASGHE